MSREREDREMIISGRRELGVTYVVLDLAGFR